MTHPELVSALKKPGEEILIALNRHDTDLWHMASCLMGEAGELFDAIKKRVIYRQTLDYTNIIEELGDIEFFLEGLRQNLNIRREEVLEKNIEKLTQRYGKLYSDAAAQQRKDKEYIRMPQGSNHYPGDDFTKETPTTPKTAE